MLSCLLAVLLTGMAQALVPRSEPVLRLQADGAFETAPDQTVRVGDTVVYRLRVSWNDIPAAVRLGPRTALEAPGFSVASTAVVHARTSRSGSLTGGDEPVVRTDYIYRLVPRETGIARVSPFVVRYHNGLTGRDEEISVPGASLTVSPPFVPLHRRTPVLILLGAAALLVLAVAMILIVRTRRAAPPPLPADAPRSDAPEAAALTALRARCDAADSRLWMAEAERVCIAWLCRKLGVTHPDHVRFEAALDRYLERNPALSLAARNSWTTLRELFHENRYARVRHEPHELHETCRLLKTCLLIDPRDAENRPSKGVNPS
jgi:hypothetical protein